MLVILFRFRWLNKVEVVFVTPFFAILLFNLLLISLVEESGHHIKLLMLHLLFSVVHCTIEGIAHNCDEHVQKNYHNQEGYYDKHYHQELSVVTRFTVGIEFKLNKTMLILTLEDVSKPNTEVACHDLALWIYTQVDEVDRLPKDHIVH